VYDDSDYWAMADLVDGPDDSPPCRDGHSHPWVDNGVGISLVNRTVEVLRQVTGPLPFPRPCVCGDFHCGTCACGCSFYEPDDGQAGVPYTSSPVNPFFWSPKQEAYR
jgi:hypothetical protein